MIAMALACEPKLLIADEPTTALDVTIQRQILELLAGAEGALPMSMLFISHDLGVVGEIADHVVVMRHGTVREQGAVGAHLRRAAGRLHAGAAGLPADARAARAAPGGDRRPHRGARRRGAEPPVAAATGRRARVIIEATRLAKSFWMRTRRVRPQASSAAVKGATFRLRQGHTLGVVGESGSGKTTMGLALLRLHEPNGGPVAAR